MALKDRIEQPRRTKPVYGELPVESLYTVGVAGERFLREIKNKGRFLGTVCKPCDEVYVPGKAFCEKCLARLDDWVKVGPRGTVESWTVLFVGLDGRPLKQPEIVGLINLDGASTNIIHRIAGVDPENVSIGLRVAPVFKPKAQRTGSVNDILHFKPARGR